MLHTLLAYWRKLYVEFRPFREISVWDGEAIELDVPAFITDLTR